MTYQVHLISMTTHMLSPTLVRVKGYLEKNCRPRAESSPVPVKLRPQRGEVGVEEKINHLIFRKVFPEQLEIFGARHQLVCPTSHYGELTPSTGWILPEILELQEPTHLNARLLDLSVLD
jgi:hypothetical protein